MSELKATTVYDAYWKANSVGEGTGVLVYLKSEADKVIEELNRKIKLYEDLGSCKKGCLALRHNQRRAESEIYRVKLKEKEILHHKYKRCLAMALWCERKRIDAANYRIPRQKWEFYDKWYKRWLELAKKFKEAK